MTPDILKTLDFGDQINIINSVSEELKKNGINNWIVGEITTVDGTYSKYTACAGLNLQNPTKNNMIEDQGDIEVLRNFLGGIATCFLDMLGDQFLKQFGRFPNGAEVFQLMLELHKIYIDNVQPQ